LIFLTELRDAHSVLAFSFTVSRPNIYDVEELFIKPAQQYLFDANGRKADITLKESAVGQSLDVDKLEPLIRTAAVTGEDVSAKLRPSAKERPRWRRLKRNYVYEIFDEDSIEFEKVSILEKIRQIYSRLRSAIEYG
jgi:hypothetical protein